MTFTGNVFSTRSLWILFVIDLVNRENLYGVSMLLQNMNSRPWDRFCFSSALKWHASLVGSCSVGHPSRFGAMSASSISPEDL